MTSWVKSVIPLAVESGFRSEEAIHLRVDDLAERMVSGHDVVWTAPAISTPTVVPYYDARLGQLQVIPGWPATSCRRLFVHRASFRAGPSRGSG